MKGKNEIKSNAKNATSQIRNSTRTEKDITAESSTANQGKKITESPIGEATSKNIKSGKTSR